MSRSEDSSKLSSAVMVVFCLAIPAMIIVCMCTGIVGYFLRLRG